MEESASGLAARFERLLIEHTFAPGLDDIPGECVGATCTWRGYFLGDWRKHVSSVLASELIRDLEALHEEKATRSITGSAAGGVRLAIERISS